MKTQKSVMLPCHLDKSTLINLGVFYTPVDYVNIVWKFIEPYIDSKTVIFDPACGNGIFLTGKIPGRKKGNDIDTKAVEIARKLVNDAEYYSYNFLMVFDRTSYSISDDDKLIITGNPPYNDTTSQAKKKVKRLRFDVDPRVKARDMGISFLKAFDHMKADYVCVLHPLSYLIKRTNFMSLQNFRENYRLMDGVIISSKCFNFTSKFSEFPVIIALYQRSETGMDYEYIESFNFKTIEGKSFRLKDFEYIGKLVDRYPQKGIQFNQDDIFFYTLRDINALKRNKTFINKPHPNAVRVNIKKLDYYIYIDVFKDFINCIPYYFGNLDILINIKLFAKYRDCFVNYALKKHQFLKKYYLQHNLYDNDETCILQYFKLLLSDHFNG